MKVSKPKSKRVPVRLRHKIQKASAAKQRKDRKQAKKNPEWRSRLKKDPGIPNLFPFKDKILAEVEEARRRKEEEALRRREVAQAQRLGTAVGAAVVEEDGDEVDEELMDPEDAGEDEDEDEMEGVQDESNPMAALLASAKARAQTFGQHEDVGELDDDEDDDDAADSEEWTGLAPNSKHKSTSHQKSSQTSNITRTPLPKRALDDPIKTVNLLLTRLQTTQQSGLQQILDYYQIPPLVTAGSDTTTRLLVDVARKRGRLGRGGIPNLHAAALLLLSDVHEERLKFGEELAAAPTSVAVAGKGKATAAAAAAAAGSKGEVQIVATMAAPFRIEGLFGDDA